MFRDLRVGLRVREVFCGSLGLAGSEAEPRSVCSRPLSQAGSLGFRAICRVDPNLADEVLDNQELLQVPSCTRDEAISIRARPRCRAGLKGCHSRKTLHLRILKLETDVLNELLAAAV